MFWLQCLSAVDGHRRGWPSSPTVDSICDHVSCGYTAGSPHHCTGCCNLPGCRADLQLLQRCCESLKKWNQGSLLFFIWNHAVYWSDVCLGQELRVWDISSHHCLKTVRLQFPCQQPGRIPEHGNFPFLLLSHPLPVQSHLLVGCKDYLALLRLTETTRGGGGWLTDDRRERGPNLQRGPALSCALYNSTLRQVVTGHADSSVSLWDVETGRRRLQILNTHGEEKLTCMALDSSHRRLITGARNGTIKVKNYSKFRCKYLFYILWET